MNETIEQFVDEGEEEIARIREARHQISEEFGHDPYRLVAYYMERQKERQGNGPSGEVERGGTTVRSPSGIGNATR
jgi:hypothetical protein